MNRALTFVILSAEAEAARHLRAALESDPRARVVKITPQPQQALEATANWRPSAVVITIHGRPEPVWQICQQVNAISPETAVILASREASPDLILESLRNGAREFLRLPVSERELRTVLDRTTEFCATRHQSGAPQRGRLLAVFAPKGGCGASFLAANLAVALDAPTVLADLNLQAASLDLYLGVKPKFSILDVIENRARLDDQMLTSFLTPHNENLSLLAAPPSAEAAEDFRPEQMLDVLELLRERAAYVVLDTPHDFGAITIAALDRADDIVVVLNLDIVSARATQRALAIFQKLGYPAAKVRLVLNRDNHQSDLELKDVEKFLGARIAQQIPDDYAAVVNSINVGQPLAAAETKSPVKTELRRLAQAYGGARAKTGEARKGLLSGLFRRQPAQTAPPKPTIASTAPLPPVRKTTQKLLPPGE